MKKILFINVTYKNASTGRLIESIVSKRPSEEIDYKVFFQQGDNEDSYSFKYENYLENLIRRISYKICGRTEWVTITQTRRLIKKIEAYNPDIIHIHTIHHQCTHYVMLFEFLKKFGKPVIITVHDCWAYTGGCYHYTEFGCRRFETGCVDCKRSADQLECKASKTAKKLTSKCDFYNSSNNVYLVGVSEWICGELKRSIIMNPNIVCIRNGIDTKVFYEKNNLQVDAKRQELLKDKKHLLIGVANAWGEGKGLSSFYKLAEDLGNEYQIVLVGGNLPANSPSDNLTFYGLTYNTDELVDIYNAADMLVNLSIEESFGLVSAEAAACGTKVIGYSSTANTEVISEVGGILVPPNDYNQIVTKIRGYFEDKGHYKSIPTNKFDFTKERMIEEYWQLYKYILGSKVDV